MRERTSRALPGLAAAVLLALPACAPAAGTAAAGAAEQPAPRAMAPGTAADVRSGPMVGFSEMRAAYLWLQTTAPARVHFVYWDTAAPGRRYTTAAVQTRAEEAHTARVVADSVEPGRRYAYEAYVDGRRVERPYAMRFQTQALWQWRTDPPPFRIAIGSCNYVNDGPYDRPGTPYGSNHRIFETIHAHRPDAMLWLGDNTYLREADWHTRSGILYRYSHTRALPELQPLLASTHNYATWDDHDYGPNNADRSWARKHVTREAFDLFWGNPPFGVEGLGGVTTQFQWQDVEFFLMDGRWSKSPEARRTGERELLGDAQIRWLIDALRTSEAPFKFVAVGVQVLSTAARGENYATMPEERQRLLDAIAAERIPGVIFLTGDRHFTELSRLERPGTYPLHDLTVSPLTAGLSSQRDEANTLRVPGTYVEQHNFALLDVSGPRPDRVLRISGRGVEGAELWGREIRAAELR